MNLNDQFFLEKLIEGYVKTPSSLKEQAITKMAIYLCSRFPLIQNFGSMFKFLDSYNNFSIRMREHFSILCETLQIPCELKPALINRTVVIAIRFFGWMTEHRVFFQSTPLEAYHFLIPSDWTAEGRIKERNIAERLVQDERISVSERYKLACLHFLEPYIHLLWIRMTPEQRKNFMDHTDSNLVRLCSSHFLGLEEHVVHENLFWQRGFEEAVKEGHRTCVVYFWGKLSENTKQDLLFEATLCAVEKSERVKRERPFTDNWNNIPEKFCDIALFLIAQMCKEQKAEFFDYVYNLDIFNCFLDPVYICYFISIVTKLWGLLREQNYVQVLQMIARFYSDRENETLYPDYNYGQLIVDILEQTPDDYKRYAFTQLSFVNDLFILILIKQPFKRGSIRIIQSIFQHSTEEERRSFIYSSYGDDLCRSVIESRHCDILDLILHCCLSEERIADFKNKFLLSATGREICFETLARKNGESVNALLKWGCFSAEAISEFKPKLICDALLENGISKNSLFEIPRYLSDLKLAWDPSEAITRLLVDINTDCVNKILQWCLPSEASRNKYKKDLMLNFDLHEGFIERWLLRGQSFEVKPLISKLSPLICWAFSSKAEIKHFKLEFSTDRFPSNMLGDLIWLGIWQNVDYYMEWLELSPKEIKQFKIDIMWKDHTIESIFPHITSFDSKDASQYLKWGLPDAETAIAFKQKLEEFYSYKSLGEEDFKKRQRRWEQAIQDRLNELVREQPNGSLDEEGEVLKEERHLCKKFKENS